MLRSVLNTNNKLIKLFPKYVSNMAVGKSLSSVLHELERFAPTCLAEDWDNVGLLIEPYDKTSVKTIMLTNDLTECVMEEAVLKKTDLIISYHPPIFAPLKRITQSNWKGLIVSRCLKESIAVYSPHTSWDSVAGGVNDWLASALPGNNIKPIKPNPNIPEFGAGRIFETNVTLQQAISCVRNHIGTDVHLSLGLEHNKETTSIKRVAVCAGSGASLLKGVEADLYITGEMSHHELLDAIHKRTSVILCNHSNSERGFLKVFREQFNKILNNECEIFVSEKDEDPLVTIK